MGFRKVFVGLILVLLVSGLAGCVLIDITVVLEPDQNWTATTDYIFDEESLQTLAAMSGEEVDMTEFEADLAAGVEEIRSAYGDRGVTADWSSLPPPEPGKIAYRTTVSGQGYDLLNEAVFDGDGSFTVEQRDNREVVVVSILGLGDEFVELLASDEMTQEMGVPGPELRFTLQGADIIETSGEIVDGNKAVWTNDPGPYEAVVVTERPQVVPDLDFGPDLDLTPDLGLGTDMPDWVVPAVIALCCCGALVVVVAVVVTLILLALSVNLLGDWLRDALNPRLR